MTTWVTSDTHFGHVLVSNLRGFDEPEDMYQHIARNWNKQVAAGDEVLILGDLAMGVFRSWLPRFRELPGRKFVIAGNHDRVHPVMSNAHKYHTEFLELGGFESVTLLARLKVAGQNVALSHFPYWGDHTEGDRFWQYRPRSHGNDVLLHGHTHSSEKFTRYPHGSFSFNNPDGPLQIHVGLDAWDLKLVDIREAVALAKEF